jgi:hypothetical protein
MGFYPTRDGRWSYLHCNFPNHRAAALSVLGVAEQAALPDAGIPSPFRIAARLSPGRAEVPFFVAGLIPSAGINLHQSPLHFARHAR